MKKLTAMLLCVILVLSLGVTALAATDRVEATVDVDNGTVCVTLTAGQATTNGVVTVAFDSGCMTYVGTETTVMASTVTEEDGVVAFGYATNDANAFAQGDVIATIVLEGKQPAEAVVTVTVENFNEETGIGDSQEIPVEVTVKQTFDDVAYGAWYYDAVEYVAEMGYFNGVSTNLFAPDMEMNRAMLVTVLYRLAGQPEVTAQAAFEDVAEGSYYAAAVVWGSENGIIKGVTETVFAPESAVTREQMVVFLHRYAVYAGMDVTVEGDLSAYPDADTVGEYAVEAMTWAVNCGVVNGMDGNLNPQGTATRAQVAQIIWKLDNMME